MDDAQILEQYEKRGGRETENTGLPRGRNKKIKDDKHAYADDVILKATETKQIYGKLESFGKAGKYHGIGINWGKIAILTKALGRGIREIKKIMPGKYRGIQFAKEATLLGKQ